MKSETIMGTILLLPGRFEMESVDSKLVETSIASNRLAPSEKK